MSEASEVDLVRTLAARDRFATDLGIELAESELGRIAVRLSITPAHLNFYGYCHGGVIFTLADSVFGLACNLGGQVAVALDAHVVFALAVRPGEQLTAQATEVSLTRRTGVYRIEVRNGEETLVAHFTGTAYRTGKPALPLPELPHG